MIATSFLVHDAAMAADIHQASTGADPAVSQSNRHGNVHVSEMEPIAPREGKVSAIGFVSDVNHERCETIRAAIASSTWIPVSISIQTGWILRISGNQADSESSNSVGPDSPLSPGSRRALLQVYRL